MDKCTDCSPAQQVILGALAMDVFYKCLRNKEIS
jgi:hypothetical protein